MIAYNAYQLYKAIEDREPLIRLIRGYRYDMRHYGPQFIADNTEIRAVDGGYDHAIIEYPIAMPHSHWSGNDIQEELWQVGDQVKLKGLIFDMGLDARDLPPEMMQCALRIVGTHCTLDDVHVRNCLKWGVHVTNNVGHHFKNGSCKDITYRLTDDPNPYTGYSYGFWFSGTPTGEPPQEVDITLIEEWEFDNMRNAVDCSQAGNSLNYQYCRFGYHSEECIGTHEAYGIHDLTVNECVFLGKDQAMNLKIHKLTGRLVLTGNKSAESTQYIGDQVQALGVPSNYLHDMENDNVLIANNDWRYEF